MSLPGAAHEFHVWADFAQRGDPDATGPAADLWNTILERQRRDSERTDEMSTTIGMTAGGFAPPKSNRTRRAEATSPLSRSGAWFSAIAAMLLVLTLGGGAYLARNGGFGFGGGGDGGEGRYAAQAVTPEASPVGNAATCDVEPLTTDEIVAIVENPNSYMPYGVFGTPPPDAEEGLQEVTDGLFEAPMSWPPRPEDSWLRVPTEGEFESAYAIADAWYACSVHGTNAQTWALLSPFEVQRRILMQFPVYLDPETLRDFVESVKDEPATPDPSMIVYADGSADGRQTYANTNLTDARVVERGAYTVLLDADHILYIGEEYRDADDTVLAVSAWDGTPLQGTRESLNGGQGTILVHSESTDRWFVVGSISPTG